MLLLPAISAIVLSACENPQVQLIEQKCGVCHGTEMIYKKRYSPGRWQQVIHGMKAAGLKLTETEEEQILRILTQNFTPAAP